MTASLPFWRPADPEVLAGVRSMPGCATRLIPVKSPSIGIPWATPSGLTPAIPGPPLNTTCDEPCGCGGCGCGNGGAGMPKAGGCGCGGCGKNGGSDPADGAAHVWTEVESTLAAASPQTPVVT